MLPERDKVIVTSAQLINVAKKHQKPDPGDDAGRHHRQGDADPRLERRARLHGRAAPTRVGYRFATDGKKVRVCRKCGS